MQGSILKIKQILNTNIEIPKVEYEGTSTDLSWSEPGVRKRVAAMEETQAEFEQQGGNKVKKLLFGTVLFALVFVVPIQAMARVDINVSISLPPPIVFAAPPELIVIPDTYVYVAPDIDVDLFFCR